MSEFLSHKKDGYRVAVVGATGAVGQKMLEVLAEPEKLLHVACASAAALTRAAYHLGNRHVPVQVGEGFLRLAADHVLEQMLKQMGAQVSSVEAAFDGSRALLKSWHARSWNN